MTRSRLLLATRNRHKVEEILGILGTGFEVYSLGDVVDPPVLVEDADTFAGNATRKAQQLAAWFQGAPAAVWSPDPVAPLGILADDSGLEVDALNGAPGVHSARFARVPPGPSGNATDAENNAKLLELLRNVPEQKRTARFRCVLAWIEVGASAVTGDLTAEGLPGSGIDVVRLFEGACEGLIGSRLSGVRGFGYDPLFIPSGYFQSFAELGAEVKNRLSHRYRALAEFKAWATADSG